MRRWCQSAFPLLKRYEETRKERNAFDYYAGLERALELIISYKLWPYVRWRCDLCWKFMQIETAYASPISHRISSLRFNSFLVRFYAFLMLLPECSLNWISFTFVHSHSEFRLCIHPVPRSSHSQADNKSRLPALRLFCHSHSLSHCWPFSSIAHLCASSHLTHANIVLFAIQFTCTQNMLMQYAFTRLHYFLSCWPSGQPAGQSTSLPMSIVGCQVHSALETKTNLFKNFYVFKFISE